MLKNLIGELIRRRVLHVLGVYLAAGWGLLEFSDWATRRFSWSTSVTDRILVVWLLCLPLVLALAWARGRSRPVRSRVDRNGKGPKSIAVLPFANMSDSADAEYLSDGITEEVINALTRIEGLQVVSRTSAFAYKGKSEDVRTIGNELNVGSVLEGSVQVAGNRLRITTQLVDVAGGFHLWSERYDREMKDVFAITCAVASFSTRTAERASSSRRRCTIGPSRSIRTTRWPTPVSRAPAR
jgi:TolB-like protein